MISNAVAMVSRSNAMLEAGRAATLDEADHYYRAASAYTAPIQVESSDARFTNGLIFDVFRVLESHGYVVASKSVAGGRPENVRDRCYADAMVKLLALVRTYEGH